MIYLNSFYGFNEKHKVQAIIGTILMIPALILLVPGTELIFDDLHALSLVLFLPGLYLSATKGSKYFITRDSLEVLHKNFPQGFDTNDLYLHLDWVWPTIETHLHADHLFIIQRDHYLVENLNDITWIFTSYGASRYLNYIFLEIILKNTKRRVVRLPHATDMDWSGYERTRQDTEDLMKYLQEQYPHLQTGFTTIRKQAFLQALPWYRKGYEWLRFAGVYDKLS